MQVIRVSLKVTVGFVPGSIGATCERPVTEPEPDAYPVLVVVTVTVTDWSGRKPVTVINPVVLILTVPTGEVTV